MGKKKSARLFDFPKATEGETAETSNAQEVSSRPDCPYLGKVVTVTVGSALQEYNVHAAILGRSSVLSSRLGDSLCLYCPDVEPEVFEVLLYHLYAQDYENCMLHHEILNENTKESLRTLCQLYCTAQKYQLSELVSFVGDKITKLGEGNYQALFSIATQVYIDLSEDDLWFRPYFRGETRKAIAAQRNLGRETWILEALTAGDRNLALDLFTVFAQAVEDGSSGNGVEAAGDRVFSKSETGSMEDALETDRVVFDEKPIDEDNVDSAHEGAISEHQSTCGEGPVNEKAAYQLHNRNEATVAAEEPTQDMHTAETYSEDSNIYWEHICCEPSSRHGTKASRKGYAQWSEPVEVGEPAADAIVEEETAEALEEPETAEVRERQSDSEFAADPVDHFIGDTPEEAAPVVEESPEDMQVQYPAPMCEAPTSDIPVDEPVAEEPATEIFDLPVEEAQLAEDGDFWYGSKRKPKRKSKSTAIARGSPSPPLLVPASTSLLDTSEPVMFDDVPVETPVLEEPVTEEPSMEVSEVPFEQPLSVEDHKIHKKDKKKPRKGSKKGRIAAPPPPPLSPITVSSSVSFLSQPEATKLDDDPTEVIIVDGPVSEEPAEAPEISTEEAPRIDDDDDDSWAFPAKKSRKTAKKNLLVDSPPLSPPAPVEPSEPTDLMTKIPCPRRSLHIAGSKWMKCHTCRSELVAIARRERATHAGFRIFTH